MPRAKTDLAVLLARKRESNRIRMRRLRQEQPERMKAVSDASREERNARQRDRWANDPVFRERQIAAKQKWKERHPDRYKSGTSAYTERTKDQTRKRSRAHYAKNRDKRLAEMRAYHATNKAARNAAARARAEADPEKERARTQNRRRIIREAGGKITAAHIRHLFVVQFNACLYCKRNLDEGYHIDHWMPIARGGLNSDSNIQLLCEPCNQSKHDKDPVEYEASIGFAR